MHGSRPPPELAHTKPCPGSQQGDLEFKREAEWIKPWVVYDIIRSSIRVNARAPWPPNFKDLSHHDFGGISRYKRRNEYTNGRRRAARILIRRSSGRRKSKSVINNHCAFNQVFL
jgi:hypothetical protein